MPAGAAGALLLWPCLRTSDAAGSDTVERKLIVESRVIGMYRIFLARRFTNGQVDGVNFKINRPGGGSVVRNGFTRLNF